MTNGAAPLAIPLQQERAHRKVQALADSGLPEGSDAVSLPDPEVLDKAVRRRFTGEYKLRILRLADHCAPGELDALLRREGLYSSHLTTWRGQRERGELAGLSPKQRGRKPAKPDPSAQRVAKLERENKQLKQRLEQAETIIEVQKKLSKLLGIPLNQPPHDANG